MPDSKFQRKITTTPINHLLDKDKIAWIATPLGKFTSKSAYDNLIKGEQKLDGMELYGANGYSQNIVPLHGRCALVHLKPKIGCVIWV